MKNLDEPSRRRDAYAMARTWLMERAEDDPRFLAVPLPITALCEAKRLALAQSDLLPSETNALLSGACIVLSRRLGAVKARFSVAHEVAHVILGTYREEDIGPEVETEADACAAGFLLPHDHLAMVLDRLRIPLPLTLGEWMEAEWKETVLTGLSRRYDVSHATVALSLLDAGMIRYEKPWYRENDGILPPAVRALLEVCERRRALRSRRDWVRRGALLWRADILGFGPGSFVGQGTDDLERWLEEQERQERSEAYSRIDGVEVRDLRFIPLPDLLTLAEDMELERGRDAALGDALMSEPW